MNINDEIIKTINTNEKIIRYKELEKIISNNTELTKQLNEIKDLQKQIVHAEKLEKSKSLENLKKQYEIKLNEFEEYPLMSEYLDLQTEINETLVAFKEIIEKGIDSDLQAN